MPNMFIHCLSHWYVLLKLVTLINMMYFDLTDNCGRQRIPNLLSALVPDRYVVEQMFVLQVYSQLSDWLNTLLTIIRM